MPAITDFYDDVFLCTDRPDLVGETAIALRRALRACHYSSEYAFDAAVETISSSGQLLTLSPIPARYRETLYIGDNKFLLLREMTPQAYFNQDAQLDKRNVYWRMGGDLHIRSMDMFSTVLHYFLKVPDFSDSEIALNHRDFLVFKAAEYVLTSIDQVAKANKYQALAQENFVELQRNTFQR